MILAEVPKHSSSDSLLSQQMPDVASGLVVHQYVEAELMQDKHTEFDEDVLPSRKRPFVAKVNT